MIQIKLTQGKVALIDDDDFEKVSMYKWHAIKSNRTDYANCYIYPDNNWKEKVTLRMHWLIIGKPPEGMVTDHKDNDGLNNQKDNLRFCSPQENSRNRVANGVSKYIGVSAVVRKSEISWRCFIGREYLGIFKSEQNAALVYNKYAKLKYGEFANLNVVEDAASFDIDKIAYEVKKQKINYK